MSRIYVASSWRNTLQPTVVEVLRSHGHEVYDFHNPAPGNEGFSWKDVGGIDGGDERRAPRPKGSDYVPAERYLEMVAHPVAKRGFAHDFDAMQWADTFVMVLPCGKSAHLELGWATGAGKRTAVLLESPMEPELMYLCADYLAPSLGDVVNWLAETSVQNNSKGANNG